jgi:hypothetical protein
LQLKRVNNLDDCYLLCSYMRSNADIAVVRGGIQMSVCWRDRCSRNAEHCGDREDHDHYAG